METEGRVLGAFVDVLAVVAVPRKTGVTHTPFGSDVGFVICKTS